MADANNNYLVEIRQVVREEVSGISDDVSDLKEEQQHQGVVLKDLQKDVSNQGILLENLDGEFRAVAESISNNLKVKTRVDDHGERITDLEADNELVKPAVALHSKQIKSLQSG